MTTDAPWEKQQGEFGDTLLDPSKEVPGFVARTKGQPSHKRFNVYRNNVMVSLTEAIRDAYPVVSKLVGEEFATAMARVYAGTNLPGSPVLLDYGEGYAAFIEVFEPASSLPFLADVARLEWAWLRSYHAEDQEPLAIDALSQFEEAELGHLRFTFCASVQMLQSDHPVVSIWSAHQGDEIEGTLENITAQGECALVNRPLWDVDVRTLEPATHAFFLTLAKGLPLAMAIDKGSTFSNFNPSEAISAVFETKTIAAITNNNLAK